MELQQSNPDAAQAANDNQARIQAFQDELRELQTKHKLRLVPILMPSDFGIFPNFTIMDEADYQKHATKQ